MTDPAAEIFVKIIATKGSAPRDAGTAMKVTLTDTEGTIGGGALEFQAIATARTILVGNGAERTQTIPLGPSLGQCCGGSVELVFTREKCGTDMRRSDVHQIKPNRPHPDFLWLWGAGHVGQAVANACPPQAFKITWVDTHKTRFPTGHERITKIPTMNMPLLAARAPTHAHHLIFTYSHEIDLALCAALLKRGAASIGLIGSDTKWARFSKRLSALGLDPSPITCPIGDKSLGKHPDSIAQGVVTSLLALHSQKAPA